MSCPDIGAIVLECTNMPPYSEAIQEAIKLPVFDVVTMVNYAYSAFVQHGFTGFAILLLSSVMSS